jgi:hypothetical protein
MRTDEVGVSWHDSMYRFPSFMDNLEISTTGTSKFRTENKRKWKARSVKRPEIRHRRSGGYAPT